jgi:hypothetical protein
MAQATRWGSEDIVRYIRADLYEAALKDAERDRALLRDVPRYLISLYERLHDCPLRDGVASLRQQIDAAIASQIGVAKENGPGT